MLAAYARLFWRIISLRAAPQDVPASVALLWLVMTFAYIATLIEGAFIFPLLKNLLCNAFDVFLLLGFLYILLSAAKLPQRFLQTAIAAGGVCVLFRVIEFPGFWILASGLFEKTNPMLQLASLYYLGIQLYSIFVMGHILRHALSTQLPLAVGLALAYVIVEQLILNALFAQNPDV